MVLPFGDICPISFLLSFVQIGIEVNDILAQETLPELTSGEFLSAITSFKLKVFFFANISPNLC